MKAIQLLGKEKIQLSELAKPEIAEKEVLIKVRAASICGTDVRMYKNGYQGILLKLELLLIFIKKG